MMAPLNLPFQMLMKQNKIRDQHWNRKELLAQYTSGWNKQKVFKHYCGNKSVSYINNCNIIETIKTAKLNINNYYITML